MRASRASGDAKAPFPGFIAPMLATTASRPPAGARWVHEVKFDGYRVQLSIHASDIKILTRRGHDWTARFKKIAEDAWHLKAKSAIIDGEVVVQGADGIADFSALQKALRSRKPSGRLVMYAFDLLYWNGLDLRREPLLERKAKLAPLIENSNILFSEHFDTDGATMLERACAMGLEGIISKVRDSRYESDRSSAWYRIRAVPQGLRKLGYSKFNLGQSGLNTDTTTRYLPNKRTRVSP